MIMAQDQPKNAQNISKPLRKVNYRLKLPDGSVAELPSQSGVALPKAGRKRSLVQVLNLQDACYNKALEEGISPQELSSLSRAWKELEDQKRILRGRPLPGSLKPETPKKTKASQPWTPSE